MSYSAAETATSTCSTAAAAAAGSSCRRSRSGSGTTSATTGRSRRSRAILRRAFDLGITHFDLANNYGPPYGSAEENFGRILRDDLAPVPRRARDLDQGRLRHVARARTASGARASTCSRASTESLARMGLDYVDIFYSHRFDPGHAARGDPGRARHRRPPGQGAVRRHLVVLAGDAPREAAAILRGLGTPLLIHQPSYSMLNRWIEPDLLDALDELGVGCIAFSPLAQGLLTDQYLDGIPRGFARGRRTASLSPDLLTDENAGAGARADRDRAAARPVARAARAGLGAARPADDVGADRREQRRAARGLARRAQTRASPTASWTRSTASRPRATSISGRARACVGTGSDPRRVSSRHGPGAETARLAELERRSIGETDPDPGTHPSLRDMAGVRPRPCPKGLPPELVARTDAGRGCRPGGAVLRDAGSPSGTFMKWSASPRPRAAVSSLAAASSSRASSCATPTRRTVDPNQRRGSVDLDPLTAVRKRRVGALPRQVGLPERTRSPCSAPRLPAARRSTTRSRAPSSVRSRAARRGESQARLLEHLERHASRRSREHVFHRGAPHPVPAFGRNHPEAADPAVVAAHTEIDDPDRLPVAHCHTRSREIDVPQREHRRERGRVDVHRHEYPRTPR